MQSFFSNALSKAVENHIGLSDTRRARLAWLALLIMRAGTICLWRLAAPGAIPAQTDFVRKRFYRFFSMSNWTARRPRAGSPNFWDVPANLGFWPCRAHAGKH